MADYGPVADIKEYVGCWHPWTWDVTGGVNKLGYRLLWPNNYDSEKSYPLVILVSGGTAGDKMDNQGLDNVSHMESWITVWDPEGASLYDVVDYEAFILIPQMTDFSDGGATLQDVFDSGQVEYKLWVNDGEYNCCRALNDLVGKLVDGSVVFYDDSDVDTPHTGLPAFSATNVNADRVYMSGFSLGGGATMRSMYFLRDKLAAVIPCAGWPIGQSTVDDQYQSSSDDYDIDYSKRIKRWCESTYHIPAIFEGGTTDETVTWSQSLGLYEAFTDTGLAFDIYRIAQTMGHSTAQFTNTFDTTKYFDPDSKAVQDLVATQAGYITPLEWMFSKTKPVTPENPYPDYPGNFDLNVVLDNDYAPQTLKRTKHNLPAGKDNLVLTEGISSYFTDNGSTNLVESSSDPGGIAEQDKGVQSELGALRVMKSTVADLEIRTAIQSILVGT